MDDARIPVTLLTGFLGSGKTTLLNRLLRHPAMGDTAVIINEFGAVALDHLLIEQVDERMVVLGNGCVCCTVRGDLVATLATLMERSESGEIPRFARVVIETTGLADPAPVLHTLMIEPSIVARFRLDGVVTTVDAVNGAATLDAHAEAVTQAAVADVLLLTKTDLADELAVQALERRLAALNPGAHREYVIAGEVAAETVLTCGGHRTAAAAAPRWLGREASAEAPRYRSITGHDARIQSHSFTFEQPVATAAFTHWVELMTAMRGESLLRVKGLLQVAEHPDEPLVVHGVQHTRRLARAVSSRRWLGPADGRKRHGGIAGIQATHQIAYGRVGADRSPRCAKRADGQRGRLAPRACARLS